jgi:octaprenyl-diphosphate synthase
MDDVTVMAAPATLTDVMALSAADRAAVDALIQSRLHSDVALVNQISTHIILGGGKRLRPLIHLLTARAAGYTGAQHIQLAAVIEFIHTATLLHDDVVDNSDQRRGQDTAHTLWGSAASVLVGDFLYSRSFQLMVELDNPEVMRILADTTNTIAAGEVLQLMQMGNADLSHADYVRVISDKTACLFAASAELGGVLAECPRALCQDLSQFGLLLGQAFQIADDVLDYRRSDGELGKNRGDDLAEGKVTLPLILALEQGSAGQQQQLRAALQHPAAEHIEAVCSLLESLGTLDQAMATAETLAAQALRCLESLPNSAERDALAILTDYSVSRSQ